MGTFRRAFTTGLGYARRLTLVLPLYLSALLLGLLQVWPLGSGGVLYNPVLGAVVERGLDGLVEILVGAPEAFGGAAGLWSAATIVLTLAYSLLYHLFSGGIISVWHGNRKFWAGCRRFFWSYVGLGLLLAPLLLIALGIGVVLGMFAGASVGAIAAFVLAQLVNLIGEYARVIAVARDRRNPLVMLGQAIVFVTRRFPGILGLAALGLALQLAIGLAYLTLAQLAHGPAQTILLEQAVVLGWLWVKLVRLAWALGYVQVGDTLRSFPSPLAPLPRWG